MRVKTKQRLTIEDIPKDNRAWMDKIISTVNDYISQSINIINDGIVFPDNFAGKEHVYDFTYQSDAISLPIGFKWPLLLAPKSVLLASATEDGSPIAITFAWDYTQDGLVRLTQVCRFTTAPAVAALQAGKRYKIRVRVQP